MGFESREAPTHVVACDSFCHKVIPDAYGEYVLVEQPNYASLDQEIVRYEVHDSLRQGLPTGLYGWYEGLVREEGDSVTAKISEAFGFGDFAWSSEACPDTTYELVGVKNPYIEEYVVVEDVMRPAGGMLRNVYVMDAETGELKLLLPHPGGTTYYYQARDIIAWFP